MPSLIEQEHDGRVLEELLTPLGFEVTPAHSGRQALALARALRPDAILLDRI